MIERGLGLGRTEGKAYVAERERHMIPLYLLEDLVFFEVVGELLLGCHFWGILDGGKLRLGYDEVLDITPGSIAQMFCWLARRSPWQRSNTFTFSGKYLAWE